MATIFGVALVMVLAILTLFPGQTEAGPGQKSLLKTLFNEYEILERPVKNGSERVLITMAFYLRQIMDIDEKQQILQSSIWLNFIWPDYRLRWDVSQHHNVSKIIVPVSKIWKPDILLWNSATQQFDATFKTNVEITNDGQISWVPPALFSSTCSIDITWFPFDLQACTLKFSSWTYEFRRVDLKPYSQKVDTSNYQRNGEWDLEDAFCERNLLTYACCPDDAWVDITVTIKLRRRVLYYMFNIIIPSIIISCIGLLTFALPCESGEKVTMSVTILLSLAFFMTMVAETLPSTSEAIPFLGIYFGSLMLLCAISLVVTVFVGSIHHRKPEITRVSPWIHKWFSCRIAVFFKMLPRDHPIITANAEFPLQDELNSVPSLRYRGNPNVANGNHSNDIPMRPIAIISSSEKSPVMGRSPRHHEFKPSYIKDSLSETALAKTSNHTQHQVSRSTPFLQDANEILNGLKIITTHIAETSRTEAIKREWRLVASVVDRIFMYISIALFIVFNFLMAILAPNTPMSVISIY